ncbi:hypothetical protein PROFUN_13528 [Planoprotostelium fungivorum]|uniref:Uncharacterized protein n=1 Tax=Planoprotostelium fungivorum TaxID=1890364 RepID=A0A2P6N3H5_9EUKA|nr:hypothetical protein PROFUN_13528 [Planoprotostelium fungivorum]
MVDQQKMKREDLERILYAGVKRLGEDDSSPDGPFWRQLIESNSPVAYFPMIKPFDMERYWKKRSLYYHVIHDIDVLSEIERLKGAEEDVFHQKEAAHVASLKERVSSNSLFPMRPFLQRVSQVLLDLISGRPFQLPTYTYITSSDITDSNRCPSGLNRVDASPFIERLTNNLHLLSSLPLPLDGDIIPPEHLQRMVQFLCILKPRGILYLLGVSHTTGSIDQLPPPIEQLISSFRRQHTLQSDNPLTVGARALSKHADRSKTDQFWGQHKGSAEEHNKRAEDILVRLFDRSLWFNLHKLPHDVTIFEMRSLDGYGARWSCDGKIFRGPQMEDGHALGWVH